MDFSHLKALLDTRRKRTTMEAKAHSKQSYTKPGQISWMEQDLAHCSRDFRPLSQEPGSGTGLSSSSLPGSKDKPIHVGVIGAGFAGLRCAEILLDHGVQVTVLEARNRLGGRVSWASKQ